VKPGENPARSRHREVDLGIGMSDFGFVQSAIPNPNSQIDKSETCLETFFARVMFRAKTFEATRHFDALFS